MVCLKDVQVVVLLGGLGSRLGGMALDVPKPMFDVHGKPFFYYQLQLLKWYGFKDFLFCVGHKGSIIEDYFKNGEGFGVNIDYSYDGDKLLGTGGAIRKAFNALSNDFLLIYGDSYMDVNYHEIVSAYFNARSSENNIKTLMTIFKNKNRFDKSNVVFKNGRLTAYDKKNTLPEMQYIDYGISVLNKSIIEKIPCDVYSDIADLYGQLVSDGLMDGYELRNRFYEIGTVPSLNEFRKYIFERLYIPKPAIFLDRDGTINEIVYNDDIEQLDSPLNPEQLKLFPNVVSALKIFKALGYRLIIVTNQPAAAKGKVPPERLYEINNRLRDILDEDDIYLDDILMCVHHPQGSGNSTKNGLISDCDCRKPKPGLLLKAMEKFCIDKENSYMVGDSHVDVLTSNAANIRSVFLGNYKCDNCKLLDYNKPSLIFKDLYEFAKFLTVNENGCLNTDNFKLE